MHEEYTLLTPENALLHYDVAGLGSRLGAATIDYLLLAVVSTILEVGGSAVIGLVAAATPDQLLSWTVGYSLLGLTILVTFLVWWGYFVLCEVLWNGQSVGKKVLRLRVVRAEGQPEGLVASFVRNLLRIIDLFLMIGVLVMLIDRSSRRLGDFAAGTLVIREPRGTAKGVLVTAYENFGIPTVPDAQVSALPNADRLTAEHYAVLREFFARQSRLEPTAARLLAQRLARELGQVIQVPFDEHADSRTFLATAVQAYEARHRYDEAGC